MSTQILDPKLLVREARSTAARTRRNRGIVPAVSLTKRRKNGAQHLVISRALTSVLGVETTHVAIEHDAETQTLVIRPSVYGEPAFKIHPTGDSDKAIANRVLSATSLRKYLGIPASFSGKLKTRVGDGCLLVDLKPAYKKGKAASAA